MEYGAVVLAGGKNTRMGGRNKAKLLYQGATFLERLEETLADFSPLYLSTNDPDLAEGTRFRVVEDRIRDRGPLGGLYSVLQQSPVFALFVLPCDMPLFSQEMIHYILQNHEGEAVLYPMAEGGREYPLCGIYTRACLPVMEEMLQEGELRMRRLAERAGGRKLIIPQKWEKREWFWNVNTPKTYYLGS